MPKNRLWASILRVSTLTVGSTNSIRKHNPGDPAYVESIPSISGIERGPISRQLSDRATFIPLRCSDLRSKLSEVFQISPSERPQYDQLCEHLQAIFHVEHLGVLLQVEEIYAHLDPDSELVDLQSIDQKQRRALTESLIDRIGEVLFSAHYKRLNAEELQRIVTIGTQFGMRLDVDFNLFDRLEIFVRGYRTVSSVRRRLRNLFRQEYFQLPEFQRLILLFRIKTPPTGKSKPKGDQSFDANRVYFKAFKNIPETDVEILLPGSRVRLTHFDKARILFPTISGAIITFYKLFRSAVVLTVAFSFNAVVGWTIFLGVVVGYVVKSVLSYFRTKSNYQYALTKSLYVKNLDNNLSVIYRILNEAEEQEVSEAILAYTLLWKHPELASTNATESRLDELAEKFLMEVSQIEVDFEVHDALAKLARLQIAARDPQGNWQAIGLRDALNSLDVVWRRLLETKIGTISHDVSEKKTLDTE